jgi:hypothetical protein
MRRAFIIAPNVGFSFGGGGGVKVALYMAQTLLENNWRVHLIALCGWRVSELDRIHGTSLRKYHREGKLVLNYLFGTRDSLMIPFPMAVRLVASYIERLTTLNSPDLVIFHDDIPKIYEKVFKYVSKPILYSHFPYAVRSYFNIVDAVEVGFERYQSYKTRLYYNDLRRVVYCDDIPKEVELVANSTVTKVFMEALWRRGVKVMYPPVTFQPKPLERAKDNSIVLVGGQPNKRVGDAVKALAELRNRGKPTPNLYVVAHHFVPWYKEWLTNLIHRLGLQQYVHFMENLPERDILNLYVSAKIVLSTAHFEPFGMSIVEGMAYGNVPIVYKGLLSGPWIDVAEKGIYGLGFRTCDELAEIICDVMNFGEKEFEAGRNKVVERASYFSLHKFEENFIGMIKI